MIECGLWLHCNEKEPLKPGLFFVTVKEILNEGMVGLACKDDQKP